MIDAEVAVDNINIAWSASDHGHLVSGQRQTYQSNLSSDDSVLFDSVDGTMLNAGMNGSHGYQSNRVE